VIESFWYDVRFALRAFVRRPALPAVAILTLAVGIAVNTAVFGVVNAALFKGVPGVERPERLAEIARDVGGESADVTHEMYRHLHRQTATLEDLAAVVLESVSISAGGEPTIRGGLVVTGNYFSMLGVQPALGRGFPPGDTLHAAAPPVVLITHDVWQREFGAAPDVIGRTAWINGVPVEVVGVLPLGFAGHHTGLLIDVFLPLGLTAPGLPDPATFSGGNTSSLELLGRLRHGVSPVRAAAALTDAADAFAREVGEASASHPYVVRVDRWGPLPAAIRGPVAAFLSVLLVLAGLALAMACVNVTTTLLARASERQRELAVRRALGASEARVIRQLVTEVGVLFLAAGGAGVLGAIWITGLIGVVEPPVQLPGRLGADFGFDVRVLGFALLLTLGAALAFSLLPAIQANRFHVVSALREGAASDPRGRVRLRSVLVGVQVAVTSVLLAAMLLFTRALQTMRALEPGWNGDDVLVTSFDLELNGTNRTAGLVFQRELLRRAASLPGVEVAALATKLPLAGRSSFGLVSVPGVLPPPGLPGFPASLNRVSPGYFRTMRIALLRGRDIAESDDGRAPPVAVVNQTMAGRLWPSADPIGQRFFVGQGERRLAFTVIGVAGDAERRSPGQAPQAFYYVPLAQWYNSGAVLHVRAVPGQSEAVAPILRATWHEVAPALPATGVRPLNEALGIFLLPQRLAAGVAGVMGVFGVLLAAIGVYGVAAFQVARRAREIAVRIALGATHGAVTRMLLRQGGRAPLTGLAVGMAIAAALSFAARDVVTGVRAGDPVVLVGVPLAMMLVVALAMTVPVWRVLDRPPMAWLRED